MPTKDFFPPRPDAHPMVYAYEENNPLYRGMLKVGYTKHDVERRVAQQYPTLRPGGKPYKIVFQESAMYEDGNSFTDHDIHRYLERRGFERLEGEWFRCTVNDVRAAWIAVKNHTENEEQRTRDFGMRPEQADAVSKTIAYFKSVDQEASSRIPKFLWNAKMRFGKTFAAYELAKKMGFQRVLVLTFKPAVESAWREDLVTHVDFEGWQFISNKDAHDNNINIDEQYAKADTSRPIVVFGSFQDLLGTNESGGIKAKNEFIHISKLFGTRVVRDETIINDEFNYIRPYKKTITPFTAEVSASVFASAENSPLDYVVKYFYPNKKTYPEQIQKLYKLVEEIETLKDAKQIIENYKQEYQQFLGNVPSFIMENDEAGFYSRLGFATVDENALTVEYRFSYTSGGGMAQRYFNVPMTEETIVELIKTLESKLTASAFAKEQRNLMTKKLREFIKERDNYTCCTCGNSTHVEPNLLLEIDHIIPVAKGGITSEENLQTLCWKCNRAKSDKILN